MVHRHEHGTLDKVILPALICSAKLFYNYDAITVNLFEFSHCCFHKMLLRAKKVFANISSLISC